VSATTLTSTSVGAATATARSRLAPLTGVAFAVTFFVAAVLWNTPNDNASNAKWSSYFASSSHRTQLLIAAFLFVIAGLCLLAFLNTIWSAVAARRSVKHSSLPVTAAAVAAAGIAAGGALMGATPGAMTFSSLHEPAAAILRLADDMAWPLIAVAGMFAAALAIATLSVQARRARVFGQTTTVISIIVAVITLVSFLWFTLIPILLWTLILGIALSVRGLETQPNT
jgi:hypothetical protein